MSPAEKKLLMHLAAREKTALEIDVQVFPTNVTRERLRLFEQLIADARDDDTPEKRAPVQGSGEKPAGTIAWGEHCEAYAQYVRRYGSEQSAERIAERHGFSYAELVALLGQEPTTWRPR